MKIDVYKRQQVQRVAPLENQQPTGKTVAFFSITSNNLVTVRKGLSLIHIWCRYHSS